MTSSLSRSLIQTQPLRRAAASPPLHYRASRFVSSRTTDASDIRQSTAETDKEKTKNAARNNQKTVKQLDEELQAKLEDISGDGGSAGIEYENGVAQGLKKEVKRNMFRVI